MSKYLKIILRTAILLLLLLLLSPFISLFLPEKLTNHTYYRLFYQVIVDRETAGCRSDEAKALSLFRYVINHEFPGGTPYKCKPLESLIYGQAYCDFQARTLNALLGISGIPCRYAMLLYRDDSVVSPHTLNEVFLDGKWCVFDPLLNIVFKDEEGNKVSLQELSDNPNLLVLNAPGYDIKTGFFSRIFPIVYQPRRSIPTLWQAHIFDHIADTYFKIFKYNFFNFYQGLYLKFKKPPLTSEDSKLFFRARNYHLAYRHDLALKYYNILLKKYPQSNYIEDAVFFCGMFYFEIKDFTKSRGFLRLILDKYPGKWKGPATFYLEKIDKEGKGDK